MHTNEVVIVLGSPNADDGTLSPIARSRADLALEHYRHSAACKILPTGGFGERFNRTDRPHAHYVAEYLESRGVAPDDILDYALSTNTVEDALLARTILARTDDLAAGRIVVVTSDFHARRAEVIFRQVFADSDLLVLAAPAPISDEERARRERHERESVERLERQGGIIIPAHLSEQHRRPPGNSDD